MRFGYYRCQHSGLLFPSDFVKNWGTYSRGLLLGPRPVSTVWNTIYTEIPICNNSADTMYPIEVCQADIDYIERSEAAQPDEMAILDGEDMNWNKRKRLIQKKQLNHPGSRLRRHLPVKLVDDLLQD